MKHNIFNIEAGDGFADRLAEHLLSKHQNLTNILIFMPNNRSILNLRRAFLQASEGKALLLPKMIALGEIDEKTILRYGKPDTELLNKLQNINPEVEVLTRNIALTQLVMAYHKARHQPMRFDQAYDLAAELAEMLDELHREGCDFSRFDTLAPAEFAEEWQEILGFLRIIREYWPDLLAEQGAMEPWLRRNTLLEILAECWMQQAPQHPVIVAGSTGSIPAVAELMKRVAALPLGEIYLPSLDMQMSDDAFAEVEASHPQASLQKLLEQLTLPRAEVQTLSEAENARRIWLSQAFLPAEHTSGWNATTLHAENALQHCYYIPCESSRQEALSIALLLRETLETPHKTAALVTTDRTLARQVRAQMLRWSVVVDDSAGTPLHHSPAGNFLLLLLEAVQEQFSVVSLLALMKHPLCRLQRDPAEIRSLIRWIEKEALRGIQPSGLLSLSERISTNASAQRLLQEMMAAVEPLQAIIAAEEAAEMDAHAIPILISALEKAAENIATDSSGNILLHKGEEGKALAELWQELSAAASEISVSFYEFTLFLRGLLASKVTRYQWQQHPRLQILSPMEARMLRADRIILGGLNEGSWPMKTEAEPWLNRPMRLALGLPAPEHHTGLLAHDFYSLAAMPEVFFTRAAKEGGAVTVPSRFLQRMQAVLEIAGGESAVKQWQSHPLKAWVTAWEENAELSPPLQPPAPCPPVEVRPRQFSATSLETLLRDPYVIYAKQILKLKKLEPLGALPEAREFGIAAHAALERFALESGWQQPDPLTFLLEKGRKELEPYMQYSPMIHALWWPRFERVAEWIMAQGWPDHILTEQQGIWQIGGFTIKARLDRMDISEEGYTIIDYKTGTPPSPKEISLGLGIQLTLTAAMVEEGCFGEEVQQKSLEGLTYWVLSGGMKGGLTKDIAMKDAPHLVAELKEKLPRMLAEYELPGKSYLARPDRRSALRYNDYEHLERSAEWGG